jgi:hypothetical protein
MVLLMVALNRIRNEQEDNSQLVSQRLSEATACSS